MGSYNPPEARPGDVLRAADVNADRAAIRRLGRVSGSGVHARSGPAGLEIAVPSSGGAYAFLAAEATISAASGATLGSGTVRLCSRVGATLTADGFDVTVYNAAGQVDGGEAGLYLAISLRDGEWSLDVAPCPA